MRVVVQRVKSARVEVAGKVVGSIGQGLLLLVGIEDADGVEDVQHVCYKIPRLRIFSDKSGRMNKSLLDLPDGQCLVVSQFTLFADVRKGQRPSFTRAGKPEFAKLMMEMFVRSMSQELQGPVETGVFGADMQVHLVNDGPVTLLMDSKQRDL